ncbi:PAS domain-containing protein [Deinococcus malanensis]|uniref:PAS domain-containing protein n=1 Tax=Deinococcus malanensis TaxID=1706855 RepID=UPI003629BD1B
MNSLWWTERRWGRAWPAESRSGCATSWPGAPPNLLPEGIIEQQGEILLVPLHHQQELVALLALAFAGNQDLPDQTLDQLRWLQPHLAQALQRAQLQGALERNEEHGRTILSALEEGVVLISSRGRIVSANQPARRLLGLPDDGPLGSVLDRHWEITDTAGFTVPPDRYPAVLALHTRQPVRNEVVCVVTGAPAGGFLSMPSRSLKAKTCRAW